MTASVLFGAATTTTSDAFGSFKDFFDSSAWSLLKNLSIFFLVLFWIATAFWVYKDARRRIEDSWLLSVAIAMGIVPFVGPLLYMLFRPPEYLEDVRERELEIKAMEQRLARRDLHCPVCRAEVDPAFLVCPVCTTRLRQSCQNCKQPLEALWQVCPYCETPIEPAALELGPTETLRPPRRERRASN